ncbi:retrovirus-related Pol polyprotein from transposon 412 [Trichonephila clavipes]|nr:retrovirus-related Pol polyprotein from transposon 412 [Trichonephila clavipes]
MDVHQLRSFLGLCTYYREFVKNFLTIARPLHKLTKAKQKFIWTIDCNNVFNKLKDALTSAPILVYPEIGKQFILDTDASHESIEAILSQEIDGQERVIAYFSKCLSKPERNYCVTRKELLAIVKAVEHFHPYLYGRRKGSAHGNADALSRRPCLESCKYCSKIGKKFVVIGPIVRQVTTPSTSALDPWSDESVQKDKLADPEIKPTLEFKKSSDEKPSWQDIAPFHPTTKPYWALWDSLHLRNGALYRKWESDEGKTFRTTALHPQSDGMVERFNRTILNNLSLLVSTNQQVWDKKLPFFLLAYRSAVHETTGYSPYQVLFGRDLRLPADLLFSRPPDAPLASEEYIEKLQARMEEMHHLARERIGMASEKMNEDPIRRKSNRTRLPRRRQSVVMESETSKRTLSEAADQLGRSLHSPKKTE